MEAAHEWRANRIVFLRQGYATSLACSKTVSAPLFHGHHKAGKVTPFKHSETPMPAPALTGPQYLREGLKLVLSPGLRLFVLLPLSINVVLFCGLIYLAVHQFELWVDTFMPTLPHWLSFLSYILWPLFVALVLLMVFFTFTMVANIIA
ncbi:Protein CysZ -like protein, partial [Pseudomonas syringae pv. aptata]